MQEKIQQALLQLAHSRENLEAELELTNQLCHDISRWCQYGRNLEKTLQRNARIIQRTLSEWAEAREELLGELDNNDDDWKG